MKVAKITDTVLQEDETTDDLDEKLVQDKNKDVNHQGDDSELKGQVIKSEDTYKMPKKEAVKEHERLVEVLESEDKKDDKKEAKAQKKELKDIKKSDEKIERKSRKTYYELGKTCDLRINTISVFLCDL